MYVRVYTYLIIKIYAAAEVRVRVRSSGICGGRSGIRVRFLRVLRFPLPIGIPPIAPHSSSSTIRGWYNRSINGRSTEWTQSHPAKNNNNEYYNSS
jgi:hypothetical protein